jgi:hypothetical protein
LFGVAACKDCIARQAPGRREPRRQASGGGKTCPESI